MSIYAPVIEAPTFPATVAPLANGLTLIHQYVPATPVVVADVWVAAGARTEPEGWGGIAHFLEHAIFKGTARQLPGEFDRAIETCGGSTNAATSHDYAHFFVTSAATYFDRTLPPLADLLLNASIPDDECDRERDVVLEELRAAQDDPDWLAFQCLCETLYCQHPYGRSILGTEEQLYQHSAERLRRFHRARYQPENTTVVVVGGIEAEPAREIVAAAFGDFVAPPECPPEPEAIEPPLREIRRCELVLPRLEQARLLLGWTGPGVENLGDAYGLDLLSVWLAEGRSSRLVRELREENHLVSEVSSGFSLQRDSSLFTISILLPSENLGLVESLVRDRLWELQQIPVSPVELRRAQRLLCNDYAFSTETPGQLAGLYGYYSTIAHPSVSVLYPQRIGQLRAEDLSRLARQYLSPERYAAVVMKPG